MSTKVPLYKTDHIQGSADAPVELIEYGDYQCPYCGKAYYVIKEAQKELGDKLKFVFRNFPLTELHAHALNAAFAAEAAAAQDKFWEMHDELFQNQQYLDDSDLIAYAERIGLNVGEFEKDFGQDPFYQKIQQDYSSGLHLRVQGTPAFFINGKEFDGSWMGREFISYLQRLAE